MDYKVSNAQTYDMGDGLQVVVEFSDTEEGFRFRLRTGDGQYRTDWSSRYGGVLSLHLPQGDIISYATPYWDGSLPTKAPFRVVPGKPVEAI